MIKFTYFKSWENAIFKWEFLKVRNCKFDQNGEKIPEKTSNKRPRNM